MFRSPGVIFAADKISPIMPCGKFFRRGEDKFFFKATRFRPAFKPLALEEKLATTPDAMKQTFARISLSRIAMETGTHSPWASRLLTQLGHEVIVAHAQKVDLITKSTRKDDRHDAKTLARLARIDPELLEAAKLTVSPTIRP